MTLPEDQECTRREHKRNVQGENKDQETQGGAIINTEKQGRNATWSKLLRAEEHRGWRGSARSHWLRIDLVHAHATFTGFLHDDVMQEIRKDLQNVQATAE
jgi:hypothetical protein